MALNGQLNTNAYETRYVQFVWSATQNIAANTSTISWTLKGAGNDTKYYTSGPISLNIAGETVYSSSTRFRLHSGDTIASGTKTITHSKNGTGSFSVSIQAAIYTYAVNCTASTTFALNNIARASQPSCVTWPNHTQNVGSFGDTIDIFMNRVSGSGFTHTVRYAFGSLSGTCIDANTGKAATAVENDFRWKIPESFMELLPASLSGSGTIYVDTYSGSTKIGTKYCGFTATVPASVKPSCTLAWTDTTGISATYGAPVKGLSNIKVTASSTQAYKSPIISVETVVNGATYVGSPIATGTLQKSGATKFTTTVTDKRGRTGTASFEIVVLDYTEPAITALTVHRCNQDGTANDRGDYVKVTFSASAANMSNKNTVTYQLQYKKTSDTNYTTESLSVLLNNFSVSNHSKTFAADGNSSYDVVVSATDLHNTVTRSTSVSTAFTLINFGAYGDAIGFGGAAEERDTIRNNMALRQVGNRYVFQAARQSTQGFTLVATIRIIGNNVNAPIVFMLTKRAALSPMKVYVTFENWADTVDPPLKTITYEGDNYNAYLIKQATSTWKLYVESYGHEPCVQDWFTTDTQADKIAVSFANEHVAGTNPNVLGTYYRATPIISKSILDAFYPVGYILLLYSHSNPNTMYPGTTWQRISGAFPWFTDSNGEIGLTGGERNVTLTVDQIPAHNHGGTYTNAGTARTHGWLASGGSSMGYDTINTGGGSAHNNMPPYIQISAWRRTE